MRNANFLSDWLEAVDAGAVVRNHMEALAVDVAHGRTRGVLLRDQITGRDARVDAGWVINCSGPWADRVCQRSAIRMAKPMLGGVRGSHIVLPRFPGSPSTALYTEAIDGRPIFILPWNDQILAGTTEVADNGDPAKTVAPIGDDVGPGPGQGQGVAVPGVDPPDAPGRRLHVAGRAG